MPHRKPRPKQHKKPTGRNGVVHLAWTKDGGDFAPQGFVLTGVKADDELTVMNAFLKVGAPAGWEKVGKLDVIQNPQNDWDFTLKSEAGSLTIELLEIAP